MKLFLLLIGIFWVVIGTLLVFVTDLVKNKFFEKFRKIDLKKWSALPIAFGILFLMAAPLSRARLFITVLGVLSFAKGFYMLLGPKNKVKKLMEWWLNAKDSLYKVWGVIALILGVLVLINI